MACGAFLVFLGLHLALHHFRGKKKKIINTSFCSKRICAAFYTTDINLFVDPADSIGMDSKCCHLVGVFADSAAVCIIADTCLCSRQALAIFVPSLVCIGYITHVFIQLIRFCCQRFFSPYPILIHLYQGKI